MISLNNKGQSLFLFVIFIPVFMLLGAFVVDIGLAKVTSNNLDDVSKLVLDYGLKNIDNNPYDSMIDLINKNDDKIDKYDIKLDKLNKIINLKVEKNSSSFFGNIIGKDKYKISINYIGYINTEGNTVIERVE